MFLPCLLLLGHSSCEQLADPPLEAGKTDEQNYAIGNVGDPISVQALQFFIVLSLYPGSRIDGSNKFTVDGRKNKGQH